MSEETRRLQMNSGTGRHTRLPDLARLHRACLATLIALVAQFALGMWLNLYVAVPSADQHAGIVQAITNGPLMLTIHALLGAFLIGATIVLLIRAIKVGDRTVVVLAAAGLAAVIGAFGAGEFFVRDGKAKMSLWMAVLTAIALLAYIYIQARTSAAARTAQARRRAESPSEPMPRPPYREYGTAMGRRQPGYGPGVPGSAPAYPRAASGPQPVYPQAGHPRARPRNGAPQQPWSGDRWYPWQPGSADIGYPGES